MSLLRMKGVKGGLIIHTGRNITVIFPEHFNVVAILQQVCDIAEIFLRHVKKVPPQRSVRKGAISAPDYKRGRFASESFYFRLGFKHC